MSSYEDFFKGRKITLLGLGLLGRGVGDAEFLAPLVKELIVTDKKSKEELTPSLERLQEFSNITYTLGDHKLEDFRDVDLVIKSAGVPLDSPYIAEAKKYNIPVRMSADLLVELAGVKSVGITGTRGKSTVTHLISHALKQAGRHVLLGGNVHGVSNLALLSEVRPDSILVLELDSWQLQGFGEAKTSPNIAVFTNLMPDHLNYYKGDMDAYFTDKANIFKFQKPGDVLIVGASVAERIRASAPPLDPITPELVPRTWKLRILGEHNRENAALATAALAALEISEVDIKAGLESFEGVEGRLQLVREVNGIKIYNDNSATTPDATIAALRAVGSPVKKNVVLIIGGDDKKLNMSNLVKEIPKWCSKVVMLKEMGTDQIRDAIFAFEPDVRVYEEESLKATVERAFSISEPSETILYSPAFSSFGKHFKNEFDRNDKFLALVKELEPA